VIHNGGRCGCCCNLKSNPGLSGMARRVDPTERTFLPYENVKHVSDCTAMPENSRRDRVSDGQAGGAGRFWLPGSGACKRRAFAAQVSFAQAGACLSDVHGYLSADTAPVESNLAKPDAPGYCSDV
jgi:hypothetical protein